jgi:hypothetical protein
MEVDPKLALDPNNLVERVHEEGLTPPNTTPEVDTSRYRGMNENTCEATTTLGLVMLPVRGATFECGEANALTSVKQLPFCS